MASTIFAITAAELEKKMFPDGSSVEFSIGDAGTDDLSTSDAEAILNTQEERLMSLMHKSRYRKLLTEIDGEVLSWSTADAETTFTTSFSPITNLKVFVNYTGGWEVRSDEDVTDRSYTPTLSSGSIVFDEALPTGSRVVVTYNHSAASSIVLLKDIVLAMASAEVARRFNFFESEEQFGRFDTWERAALAAAQGLAKGTQGIKVFDDLDLVYLETDENFYHVFLRKAQ